MEVVRQGEAAAVAPLAGVLFLFAGVVFWRSSIPPGERQPWMR
jgi:hypothetical protein